MLSIAPRPDNGVAGACARNRTPVSTIRKARPATERRRRLGQRGCPGSGGGAKHGRFYLDQAFHQSENCLESMRCGGVDGHAVKGFEERRRYPAGRVAQVYAHSLVSRYQARPAVIEEADVDIGVANWSRMTRDQQISALARQRGIARTCPACGRFVEVVRGYWTQHTDPGSWGQRKVPMACVLELTPAG